MENEFLVFLISAAPIVELRAAIPFGIAKGLSTGTVFILAVLGNIIPIFPLLVFFRWGVKKIERMGLIGKILRWWFDRVERKSRIVQTYGFWGLVLFVSIPFPGTGVWSGSVAATLLELRLSKAFLAISLGMLTAAILVTLGSTGIIKLWSIFI